MPIITTLETDLDRTVTILYNPGPNDYFLTIDVPDDPRRSISTLLSPAEAAQVSAALVSTVPLPEPVRPLAVGDVLHRGGFTRTVVWVSEAGDHALAVDSDDGQATSYGDKDNMSYTLEEGLYERARAEGREAQR